MESTTKKIIFWTAVVGALSGVGFYMYSQFKLLGDTCYAFAGAVVKKISLTQVDLTILFKLLNHSDIGLTVVKQSYDIYMNDIAVSRILRTKSFELPANSNKVMSLAVSFVPKDLLKAGWEAIQQLIKDESKIMITVKGSIGVKSGMFSFRTLEFEVKMSLKEMIDIYKAPSSDVCKDFK